MAMLSPGLVGSTPVTGADTQLPLTPLEDLQRVERERRNAIAHRESGIEGAEREEVVLQRELTDRRPPAGGAMKQVDRHFVFHVRRTPPSGGSMKRSSVAIASSPSMATSAAK